MGNHLDLHSFPTRRSSDLVTVLVHETTARAAIILNPILRFFLKRMAEFPAPRHARLADRKSTRLNSSHQIISYAVFCLKKKNLELMVSCFAFSYKLRWALS